MLTDGDNFKKNIRHTSWLVVKLYDDYRGNINTELFWQPVFKLFPGLQINKLFQSLSEENIAALINKAVNRDSTYSPPDLLKYFHVICNNEINPDEVLDEFQKLEFVEFSYIQGKGINPSTGIKTTEVSSMPGYLGPAPQGIDAMYAWKINGGKGEGDVKFIDIEQGWRLDYDDLNIKALPLTGINQIMYGDHGAAVLEIIKGKINNQIPGITPLASGYIMSQWRPDGSPNEADAILSAIYYLNPGDILLLESQTYHVSTGNKLWPVEIHRANYDTIRLATTLGIIVVEAGGNGDTGIQKGNDLDDLKINGKNILCRTGKDFKDSGAILVAAASVDVPHTRSKYSNFGSRIDCYAAGVSSFAKLNGTSCAAAIIAGATIAVQSIAETNERNRLSPQQMRSVFSNSLYSTSSLNGHETDKIGTMPDLKKIIQDYLHIQLRY